MSQGDPTFNASHQIAVLVNELRYADGDATENIVRAIEVIRRRADMLEQLRPWNAPTDTTMMDQLRQADQFAHNPAPPPAAATGDLTQSLSAGGPMTFQRVGEYVSAGGHGPSPKES